MKRPQITPENQESVLELLCRYVVGERLAENIQNIGLFYIL